MIWVLILNDIIMLPVLAVFLSSPRSDEFPRNICAYFEDIRTTIVASQNMNMAALSQDSREIPMPLYRITLGDAVGTV